jgi:hypothetical protein
MKAWMNKLASFAHVVPAAWLLAGLAVLIAAGLLSAFVDALHENLRRGEALRMAQGRPQPAYVAMADAGPGQAMPAPRLR